MSFTNYGELKSMVADTLDRSDLADKIPLFIRLGFIWTQRRLKNKLNEKQQAGTLSAATLTVPADLVTVQLLRVNGRPLLRKTMAELTEALRLDAAASETRYFTRIGNEYHFYPAAEAGATYDLWYYADLSQGLVNDTDTNALLSVAPDLCLYAACIHATPYLKAEDRRATLWAEMYATSLQLVNDLTLEEALAGSPNTIQNGVRVL
jgi:hypothetical protein